MTSFIRTVFYFLIASPLVAAQNCPGGASLPAVNGVCPPGFTHIGNDNCCPNVIPSSQGNPFVGPLGGSRTCNDLLDRDSCVSKEYLCTHSNYRSFMAYFCASTCNACEELNGRPTFPTPVRSLLCKDANLK
ncbi:hypothetical protein L596_006821 [Steinernema carpocapsae]|uniref:ShKT domain-containing protein n=1 Tax=Steinernema carpocapsae TaxID=34508 RepID=A0A4V6A5Q9_STECR|nr:hypothetical protein L596_006821 [Steinernema carpocapsae]